MKNPMTPEEKNDDPLTEEENKLIEQGLDQIRLVDKYREALEIIAGKRQCANNLMSNVDIANEALKPIENNNPWRPIVKGEWPECKPYALIELKYPDGRIKMRIASRFAWDITTAIEWRYAEDEWNEPEPEETNPWRPIIKGEWPGCKSGAEIIVRNADKHTQQTRAGTWNWINTDAIAWKYAEDE